MPGGLELSAKGTIPRKTTTHPIQHEQCPFHSHHLRCRGEVHTDAKTQVDQKRCS